MPVIFNLGAVSNRKAQARKYVDDFVLDNRKRVAGAHGYGVGRTCKVEV